MDFVYHTESTARAHHPSQRGIMRAELMDITMRKRGEKGSLYASETPVGNMNRATCAVYILVA